MGVKAKLIIDEMEINLLEFSFGFDQGADRTGRPAQKPLFLGLQLKIETRKDLNLADWSFATNEIKQIEVHIYPVILGGKTRKINFIDCHLLNWTNNFSSTGNEPLAETLNISSAGFKDSNSSIEYSSYWRTTMPDQDVEETTLEEVEPEIVEMYYTDIENNEIPENSLTRGKEVFLVLNTKNASGKELAIDLDNNKLDFEYNGEALTEDILHVNITADVMKLKLKTIVQQN